MRNVALLGASILLLAGCSGKTGSTGTTGAPVSSNGDFSMTLSFEPAPPKLGSETLTLTVKDASGKPVTGATVTMGSKMPDMQMSGPSLHLQDNGDGTYSAVANLTYQTKWVFDARAAIQGKSGSAEFVEDLK